MRWLMRLFRKRKVEAQLDAELRFHIEQRTADLIATGVAPAEARRRARIEFGSIDRAKEECRQVRGWTFAEDTWRDICYGARMLRKSPGFAITAILTLALGIGLNSTIFSMLNGLFLQEPPVRSPQNVVVITLADTTTGATRIPPTPVEFAAWRKNAGALKEIAAADREFRVLTGTGEPKRVTVELVTPNYFRTAGVSPMRGRGLASEGPSKQRREVVISEHLWRQEFGASPKILGKNIVLSNRGYTVIGVMPPAIKYALGPCDAWIPTDIGAFAMKPQLARNRDLDVVGRLKNGVPIGRAQAELAVTQQRLAKTNPAEKGLGLRVETLRHFRTRDTRRTFDPILMALTAIVLLVACVNLAGIFLARCATRRHEFTIRAALGAGRWRTVRQLVTEALLLGLLGGSAALLGSIWGVTALRSGLGANPAVAWQIARIRVDPTVLLFTFCVSVVAALLFGLAPSIHSSKTDLNSALKESGQSASLGASRHWMRNSFVITQVALAVFLTVVAGTMALRLFRQLIGQRGFDPQGVLTVELQLSGSHYVHPAQQTAFFSEAIRRIQGLPGVRFAAAHRNCLSPANKTYRLKRAAAQKRFPHYGPWLPFTPFPQAISA